MERVNNPDTQYPLFNRPVPNGGYCWWYIDAISDDQQHMLTIIAFIGSVFSPYYRRARRNNHADPLNHCSINVVLYGRQLLNRWCMTERPKHVIDVSPDRFVIGPSHLRYRETAPGQGILHIEIDEKTAPAPRDVKGTIEVALSVQPQQFYLHPNQQHVWWPAAPNSAVKVNLKRPDLSWNGQAYVDMNWGRQPLEDDIDYWCWSRHHTGNATTIHYDVHHKDSDIEAPPDDSIAVAITDNQLSQVAEAGCRRALPRTKWRMPRHVRSAQGNAAVERTLEDTPFYSRSLITTETNREAGSGIHESVSLVRFCQPVVQAMLHCRMPRFPFSRKPMLKA
jgi:carotenoid 1,2-hydratase